MVLALDTDFIMFALEQEEQQMRDWKKQLQYDKEISHARKNLKQLLKVLSSFWTLNDLCFFVPHESILHRSIEYKYVRCPHQSPDLETFQFPNGAG